MGAATNLICILAIAMFVNTIPPLMFNSVLGLGLPVHLIASVKGVQKPTDYDSFVTDLSIDENDTDKNSEKSDRNPNIIVIMSESFSDLALDRDLKTNEDYMPHIRSLMKEQKSGVLFSSILGNNTVSSEYEFLTGVPTAFADKGSNLFMRYLDEGEIKSTNLDYPELNEYISLIKETDTATQKLISYFENVEEDTIIVFFGDHQPMLDNEIYRKLCGEDDWKKYQVPYFIWTNFDSDITVPKEASINYLPNIVLDTAGIEKNQWFSFTETVFKEFPIVTDTYIRTRNGMEYKEDVIKQLEDVKATDVDDPYYSLKQLQVWSYKKAIE